MHEEASSNEKPKLLEELHNGLGDLFSICALGERMDGEEGVHVSKLSRIATAEIRMIVRTRDQDRDQGQ